MITVHAPPPNELWLMSPEAFNQWRRENDLPHLLEFFSNVLPGWTEWCQEFSLEAYLIRLVPTGGFLLGKKRKLIVEYVAKDGRQNIIFENDESDLEQRYLRHEYRIITKVRFVPYLTWAARKYRKEKFIPLNVESKSYVAKPQYGGWRNREPQSSRACLQRGFEVLKLGGVSLPDDVIVGSRNLDFADLDFLEITGECHGGVGTSISFSSCRGMRLLDAKLHHFVFVSCHVSDFSVRDSEIQNFSFVDSEVFEPVFKNSVLFKLSFKECNVRRPIIDDCQINGLDYTPRSAVVYYSWESDNYRIIRAAFQNIGRRDDASRYYYLERCYERKYLSNPYLAHRELFPPMGYAGTVRGLLDHWKNGHFTTSQVLKFLFAIVWFHLKTWLIPWYAIRALRFKWRWLVSVLEWAIWGYGEKPGRIIVSASIPLALGAIAYYFSDNPKLSGNLLSSIYFSVVTFTTLGYGDISPENYHYISNIGLIPLKVITAVQALIGAFTIGLIVAGFSNKSRY